MSHHPGRLPVVMLFAKLEPLRAELDAAGKKYATAVHWPRFQEWHSEVLSLLNARFSGDDWQLRMFADIQFRRYASGAPLRGIAIQSIPRLVELSAAARAPENEELFRRAVPTALQWFDDVAQHTIELESPTPGPTSAITVNLHPRSIGMAGFEEKRQRRFQYLEALYQALDGRSDPHNTHEDQIRSRLGWAPEEIADVSGYLKGEGLITYVAFGPLVALTHAGMKAFERGPSRFGLHDEAPAAQVNVTYAGGDIRDAQISQASPHSTQVQQHGIDFAGLERLIAEIRESTEVHPTAKAHLDAILGEVVNQKSQSKPDRGVLKGVLISAKTILEGAGGALLAEKVAALIGGL